MEQKITGGVSKDIDTIYDRINYTQSCVERLVEEWQAQDLGMSYEYFEILDLQESMNRAKELINRIRNWREPERVLKPT